MAAVRNPILLPMTSTPPEASAAPMSQAATGLALIVLAALLFAAMNALTRYVTAEVHPFVIAFWRNALGILVFLPLILRQGRRAFRTDHFGAHVGRSAINLLSMVIFMYALSVETLARVTTLNFTAPLFITIAAAIFLGERFRIRRILALVVGFAGVVIVLRPGMIPLNIGGVLSIVSAATWALTVVMIKRAARTETGTSITLYATVLMTPMSLLVALPWWQWLTPEQFGIALAMAFLGTVGQWITAHGIRIADASLVMTGDFTKLIWVSIIGWVALGELPDRWDAIGGVVIIASVLYIARREQVVARQRAVQRRSEGGTS
ncbi:MAG: DMT family transporter [Alphaproteobacteria bacterium]|nr:DMT family transporter [Alphaproteobacteria bacterium]